MTQSFGPRDLVSFHAPIDVAQPLMHPYFSGAIGRIVRLERNSGIDGARCTRVDSASTFWIDLCYLHPCSEEQYRAWHGGKIGTQKVPTVAPETTSSWEERDLDRKLDNADILVAVDKLLKRKWGVGPDPRPVMKPPAAAGSEPVGGEQLDLFGDAA